MEAPRIFGDSGTRLRGMIESKKEFIRRVVREAGFNGGIWLEYRVVVAQTSG